MAESSADDELRRLQVEVLIESYKKYGTGIDVLEGKNEQLIGFGLTILGAAIVYGLSNHIPEVFIAVPLAVICIGIYATFLYNLMAALGGCNHAIEEQLNHLLPDDGRDLMVWEKHLSQRYVQHAVPSYAFVGAFILFCAAVSVYCLQRVWHYFGSVVFAIDLVFFLALLFVLIVCLRAMNQTYERAHREAHRALLGP